MSCIDLRETTTKERIKIGFSNLKDNWENAAAHFNAEALSICGHPVMESWEDDYMKELAKIATAKSGRVLEVGFGMGISAAHVQRYKLHEHVIIEANRDVFERLERFAAQAVRPTSPVFGFWEDVVGQMPNDSFNGILFDTYPLTVSEIHRNHFNFFSEAFRLLKPGGRLTYYSDEPEVLGDEHVDALIRAGFEPEGIDWRVCRVNPPRDCLYWQSPTIVAPIIEKK